MVHSRNHIRFILNGSQVELDDVKPDDMLLDYIRLNRRLTGTKEGCAEGDCGACTVLVGRLVKGGLAYESVNSCIRFLASIDGCHVVTIEHLSNGGDLHPVQQAMVQEHGSQCGFCTPGIVMSLYALWMEKPHPSRVEIEQALQGNLCRCTGYAPIIRAAQAVFGNPVEDVLAKERATTIAELRDLNDGKRIEMEGSDGSIFLPANTDDLSQILHQNPDATLVAGSTDVGLWVTKFMRTIAPVVHIGHLPELKTISVEDHTIHVGAGVTYSEFEETLSAHFPQLCRFWSRIGGWQVRNMGTIGGNIANGSPIGDTPPMLIALGGEVTLKGQNSSRQVRLEDFFIDYGKQNLRAGEFLEMLHIPLPAPSDIFEVHKISKRKDEDISSVCGAFWIRLNDGKVEDARIAFGGMAPIPKRAEAVEKHLISKEWSEQSVTLAQAGFADDFTPISDMRASARYRALVAKNLLMRVYQDSVAKLEAAE